ncbi:hypothetical protein NPIL_440811, partial [Nephila pilipes]
HLKATICRRAVVLCVSRRLGTSCQAELSFWNMKDLDNGRRWILVSVTFIGNLFWFVRCLL